MSESQDLKDKMISAYDRMLKRIGELARDSKPHLEQALDKAAEKATELEELSREEAERVAAYLRRDLDDAADFIDKTGEGLGDWLKFDIGLVERELLDEFSHMVDHTRASLDKLERDANRYGEWHSGEVVSIGTLECKACGEKLHFHHTGHIPPCPKCRGSKFRRISRED